MNNVFLPGDKVIYTGREAHIPYVVFTFECYSQEGLAYITCDKLYSGIHFCVNSNDLLAEGGPKDRAYAPTKLVKRLCECGAQSVGCRNHSGWCPLSN